MPRIPIDSAVTTTPLHLVGDPELENLALAEHRIRNDVILRELAVSSAWLDGTQRLFPKNPGSPAPETPSAAAFALDVDRRRAEVVRRAPSHLRQSINEAIRPVNAQLAERAAWAEATKRTIERVENIHRIRDNYAAIATHDPTQLQVVAERIDQLSEALPYPEERREAMRTEMREAVAGAVIESLFTDPGAAVSALKHGEFDSLLSAETKKAWMERAAQRLVEEREERANRTQLNFTAAAEQGMLDPAALEDAVAHGFVTEGQKSWFLETDAAARESRVVRTIAVERVRLADRPLDPDQPQSQADIDAHWEKVRPLFVSDDPVEQRVSELAYVKRFGLLPTALRKTYLARLQASEPALRVDAARALAGIEAINPRLLDDVPPHLRVLAQAMAEVAGTGSRPEDVVRIAEEAVRHRREDVADDQSPPPVRAANSAGVSLDRPYMQSLRESDDFLALLDEAESLSESDAADLIRSAGMSPALTPIALRVIEMSKLAFEERAAALDEIRSETRGLPDAWGDQKKGLLRFLDDLEPILDQPEKILQALGASRHLFRAIEPAVRPADRQLSAALRPLEARGTMQIGLIPVETEQGGRPEFRVAFFRPGQTQPFMTLPQGITIKLAQNADKFSERLDFLSRWLSGELQGEALQTEARRLFVRTRRARGRGRRRVIVDDEAYRAFLEADDAISDPQARNAVLSAFLPVVFPELSQDENLLFEIALDLIPVVGEIRSAQAAARSFRQMAEALENGEKNKALEHAFWVSWVSSALYLWLGTLPAHFGVPEQDSSEIQKSRSGYGKANT